MLKDRVSTTTKGRSSLIRAAASMAIVILALMLAACQPADQPAPAQNIGGNGQRPNFQMQPAPELPATQPVARGFVIRHEANSLVVGMGNPNFRPGQNGTPNGGTPRPTPNGTPRARPTQVGAGTEVTVTVTGDTVVYQDVTFASLNGQPPSGTTQQKVEKSGLDAMGDNVRVTIWGDQSGDQITAKVVVYSQLQNFPQQ